MLYCLLIIIKKYIFFFRFIEMKNDGHWFIMVIMNKLQKIIKLLLILFVI